MIFARRCAAYVACFATFFQSVSPGIAGLLSSTSIALDGDATSFSVRLVSYTSQDQTPFASIPALEIKGWREGLKNFSASRVPSKQQETPFYKTHLWMGKPVAFSLGGVTLEWVGPQIFKLSETLVSGGIQKSGMSSSLTLDLPHSGLLLKNLDMASLTINTAQTVIQEGVNAESFKISGNIRITSQGSLTFQNLSVLKGSFLNEGTLSSSSTSTFHVKKKARFENKGLVEQKETAWWSGKGRVVNQTGATLAFADTATLSDLSFINKGLLTAASSLAGSLGFLQNSGTVHAHTWSDFVIQNLDNTGTIQGTGTLTLASQSRNDHHLSGALQLTLEDTLTNTKHLEIRELSGTGTLKNSGNVLVSKALPQGIRYKNKGMIEAHAYEIPSQATPVFFDEGKWKLMQLNALALPPSTALTLKGTWEVDTLKAARPILNQAALTLGELRGNCPKLTNTAQIFLTRGDLGQDLS